MKCVEQMEGAGLRLGSERRYFAAVLNRLQGSRMLQGCLFLGVWQLCLTCSSWDNQTWPWGAEIPALVGWGELPPRPPSSVLSLQKTHGEEREEQAKEPLTLEQ